MFGCFGRIREILVCMHDRLTLREISEMPVRLYTSAPSPIIQLHTVLPWNFHPSHATVKRPNVAMSSST